jgi:hypothetical protein
MPNLKTIWICPYLTTNEDVDWRPFDHTATKMVKALKGIPFKGYFRASPAGESRRFDSFTAREFVPTIHKVLAGAILSRTRGDVTLVPIPNSKVTSVDYPEFATKSLAEGIAALGEGRLKCDPHLTFLEEQSSSHSGGGSRDPSYFEGAYKVEGRPTGQIVLVDDVLTSGAHLIGAYWKLSDLGCDLPLAATWGRTVHEQREPKFRIVEDELDVSRITFDFDEL